MPNVRRTAVHDRLERLDDLCGFQRESDWRKTCRKPSVRCELSQGGEPSMSGELTGCSSRGIDRFEEE